MAEKTLTVEELMALFEDVDFIDVVEIGEPGTNQLRLVVEQMALNRRSLKNDAPPVDRAMKVEKSADGLRVEISWERYGVYQVLNESYDSGNGPYEAFEGNLFRRYSKSRYLSFVEDAFANVVFLSPGYQHWAIVGQNHIVHVISGSAPQIRLLD